MPPAQECAALGTRIHEGWRSPSAGCVLSFDHSPRTAGLRLPLQRLQGNVHRGISPQTHSRVLGGKLQCRYGEAHKIAVLLGIKDGEIVEGEGHEHT